MDGKNTDAASGAVDQDGLAGLQLGALEKALPGGQGGDGDGGGLGVVEGFRLGGEGGDGRDAIFGLGAVDEPVVQAEDGIADLEGFDVGTEGGDDAGEFMAEHNGKRAQATCLGVKGGIPLQFGGCDGGGVDADEGFAVGGMGRGDVAEDEGVGLGFSIQVNGVHDGGSRFLLYVEPGGVENEGGAPRFQVFRGRRKYRCEENPGWESEGSGTWRDAVSFRAFAVGEGGVCGGAADGFGRVRHGRLDGDVAGWLFQGATGVAGVPAARRSM